MAEHQADAADAFPCGVCGRALRDDDPPKTCKQCVGRARADLHGIVNAYALLPAIVHSPLGSNAPRPQEGGRPTEKPMPGGNALTMLAGGSPATGALRRWLKDPDTEPPWGADDSNGDPVSIAYELGRHEDDWRRVRGQPAALSRYYVASAVAYLLENLSWAARAHPDFAAFVADLRSLRAVLERVTELDDQPVRADAPCFGRDDTSHCGGTLERRYRPCHHRDGQRHEGCGLEDDYTCNRCRRVYTPAAYYLAVRAELETRATQQQEG